jgi:hypothetical protein
VRLSVAELQRSVPFVISVAPVKLGAVVSTVNGRARDPDPVFQEIPVIVILALYDPSTRGGATVIL